MRPGSFLTSDFTILEKLYHPLGYYAISLLNKGLASEAMGNYQVNIEELIGKLEKVKTAILEKERSFSGEFFEQIHPRNRRSAVNLIHYLALRSFDLREIQEQLSTLGISSLSHSERYTLVNIENILFILYRLLGTKPAAELPGVSGFDYPAGRKRLRENTDAVFGPSAHGRSRFMLTLPSEAATEYVLVEKLVEQGMDVARINCSYNSETEWHAMVKNVKKASEKLGVNCKIYMDLPGPKLRTGPVDPRLENKKKKGPAIRLFPGDLLDIFRQEIIGKNAERDEDGKMVVSAKISTTLPQIWPDLRVGQPIFFNDGKIGGKIIGIGPEKLQVQITKAKKVKGSALRGIKGINLPETNISLPALTPQDLEILPFVCKNADMLGYSFVRKTSDILALQEHMNTIDCQDLPVILKIETREAFENLPELLIQSMQRPSFGVMLARGDLAVEVGFSRIAEVQEELLWICDAAHVPIIWATQVLENLVKKGMASRAEITDAAMSIRAECVMLNKGPYLNEALEVINSIEERMSQHMFKKHGALRPLRVAERFFEQEHKLLSNK